MLAKVDQQATYLWRVHGLDYYNATELEPEKYGQQKEAMRKLRGPAPPEELLESDAGVIPYRMLYRMPPTRDRMGKTVR